MEVEKVQLFDFRYTIGKNITYFIQLKGYTKSSVSRLTTITKAELEQLIKGEFSDPVLYQKQIIRLTKSLNLPNDYFLKQTIERPEKWQLSNKHRTASPKINLLAQESLEDLEELISIAPFYIKNHVKNPLKEREDY